MGKNKTECTCGTEGTVHIPGCNLNQGSSVLGDLFNRATPKEREVLRRDYERASARFNNPPKR